jgi:hypothetical protein
MDTQQQQQREQQAQELKNLADGLRPAVQAVLDVVVTGAKAVLVMPGAADDVWAATVINVAESLGLDMEQPGQLSAAVAITELVMQQAGYER